MLKLASLSLVALLTLSPSFAANKPKVEPAKECVTPDVAKAKIKKGKIEAELTGDDLKRFHTNYTRAYKADPPNDVDRLIVVSYPETPEVFFVIVFRAGCVIGISGLDAAEFKKLNSADDGSV